MAETALSEIIVEVEEEVEENQEEVEEEKKEEVEKSPEVKKKTINNTVVDAATKEKMEEISLYSDFEDDLDEGSAHREETSLRRESQVLWRWKDTERFN